MYLIFEFHVASFRGQLIIQDHNKSENLLTIENKIVYRNTFYNKEKQYWHYVKIILVPTYVSLKIKTIRYFAWKH